MSISEKDKAFIWHPLTQHKLHPDHLVIKRAKGALLFDENDKSYIDGIASWYTCMYGHSHPMIIEKVKDQLSVLDQVVFSGFTHAPAVKLAEKLVPLLPGDISKVFFSDNGSTSVDIAIKMALQYFFNKGEKRDKIICLENAFHGDTFGAMSVSGLSVYNGPFEDFLLSVERLKVPTDDNIEMVLEELETLLRKGEVAAFIYEPLVQGAAAMHMYKPEHLDKLLALTQAHGTLNIADEVMTGFGKTGSVFASDQVPHTPDIICLSKSLTAGVAPMALTCCTDWIYQAFYDNELAKGFFHGHTYSANPLACTAALAGLELLLSEEIQEMIQRIHKRHIEFAKKMDAHPMIKSARVLGVIMALDLNVDVQRYGGLRDKFYKFYMDQGIFLRPLGNTVYILAPFVISDEELTQIYNSIEQSLEVLL